jgi:hypothetical protein
LLQAIGADDADTPGLVRKHAEWVEV